MVKMNKLSEVSLQDYVKTIYTTPCSLEYTHNGAVRRANLFAERDSVVIIIYNVTREVLVLVRQFRPAVFIHDVSATDRLQTIDVSKYPSQKANALEFCAGLVDKTAPLIRIAQEEVLEECGYNAPIENLKEIFTIANGVDTTGASQTLYYCEVTDDMKVSMGGGIDDEIIDVVEMTISEMQKYVTNNDVCSPGSLLLGFYWLLENKLRRK